MGARSLQATAETQPTVRATRWPQNAQKAERLRQVARYLRAGFSVEDICQALKSQLPQTQWPNPNQIRKDRELLLAIYRDEAMRDVSDHVAWLDARYKAAADDAYRLYLESQYARYEPHTIRRQNFYRGLPAQEHGPVDEVREVRVTREGREARLIEGASHHERAQILATHVKILDSARVLHLGNKSTAVSVQVNTTNQTAILAGAAAQNLDLREVARQLARRTDGDLSLLRDEDGVIEAEAHAIECEIGAELDRLLDSPSVPNRIDEEDEDDGD